eukprot:1142554-Pelagomonas_calceolata.AAC.1
MTTQTCNDSSFDGGILLTERADLGIGTSELHMFLISYVIEITDITDQTHAIGPDSLFNSKGVNPQPEFGSVAKNVMGKIQVHVSRHCIRRVSCMCISDRKCVPLVITAHCCSLWDQGL